jgi:hypothetical protein
LNKKAQVIDDKTILKYDPELQGAYRAAYHVRAALLQMGFLQVWGRKSWSFSGDWVEKFFLLSNIGLLYFDKPGV